MGNLTLRWKSCSYLFPVCRCLPRLPFREEYEVAGADAATTYDDDTTVKRYVDSSSRVTIREFTAHDGKLLCVATFAHRGNTISCVKIEQSCKASY